VDWAERRPPRATHIDRRSRVTFDTRLFAPTCRIDGTRNPGLSVNHRSDARAGFGGKVRATGRQDLKSGALAHLRVLGSFATLGLAAKLRGKTRKPLPGITRGTVLRSSLTIGGLTLRPSLQNPRCRN
jgi:hypothetical protein